MLSTEELRELAQKKYDSAKTARTPHALEKFQEFEHLILKAAGEGSTASEPVEFGFHELTKWCFAYYCDKHSFEPCYILGDDGEAAGGIINFSNLIKEGV